MLKRLLSNLVGRLRLDVDPEDTISLEVARQRLSDGDFAGAWEACQQARGRLGGTADILALEGGIFAMRGHYGEARPLLEAALRLEPQHPQANADLGNLALAERRYEEAAVFMERALEYDPDNPAVLRNRAQVERACGRWSEAEHRLLAILSRMPGDVATLEMLFAIYDEAERYDKALALAERLLLENPGNGHWLRMRGFLFYKRLFEPAEADRIFDEAERTGECNAAFWIDRGICARDLGDGQRAERYFDKALGAEPDNPLPVFHKGLLRLYQQRYAEGWDAYEIRLRDEHWLDAPLPAPSWQGEPLGGPLLVMAEQGLGDEIMFSSCLNDLPSDHEVYVDCAEKLLPIFKESFPAVHVVAKGELPAIAARQAKARAIPIGSLPGLFRRSQASFPRRAYLRAPSQAIESAKQKLAGLPGLKVGLSWRGGTEITRKRLRSLPLDEVGQLAGVPGVEWINLQYGDCSEELAQLRSRYGLAVHHWPEFLDPYAMTAGLVQALDLVISVDTTIVHLAGALGQRVWVLVPRVPEWRYGFTACEMPWYASVEILRQQVAGSWEAPMAEVVARLRSQISAMDA